MAERGKALANPINTIRQTGKLIVGAKCDTACDFMTPVAHHLMQTLRKQLKYDLISVSLEIMPVNKTVSLSDFVRDDSLMLM